MKYAKTGNGVWIRVDISTLRSALMSCLAITDDLLLQPEEIQSVEKLRAALTEMSKKIRGALFVADNVQEDDELKILQMKAGEKHG